MTRLDASNEPSMEDILASIRKIIAEDPPGSRAAPPAPVAAPRTVDPSPAVQHVTQPAATAASAAFPSSAFSHTPQRDAAYASKPAAQSAGAPVEPFAQEPYLKSSTVKSAPSSFIPQAEPFFPKASTSAPARIEPSFESAPIEIAPVKAAAPEAAPVRIPAALSVDAQLSDLLGDVMHAPLRLPSAVDGSKAQTGFPASLTASLPDQGATPAPSPAAEPVPVVEHRGGFTISRDGYQAPKTVAEAERDPFDFDLGPSPFEAKAAEKITEPAPVAAPVNYDQPVAADAKVDPVAQATATRPVEMPRPAAAPVVAIEPLVAVAVAETAPTAAAVEPALVAEVPRPYFVAAPSVAATLAPKAPATVVADAAKPIERTPEPTAPKSAERVEHAGIVVERPAENMSDAETITVIEMNERAEARHIAVVEHDAQLPVEGAQRTMEDTVAELLRPMLRTWLAENMPRIVERALRREISEQLHSEHKAAAE